MKTTLLCMTVLLGQMITHQSKEVVHMAPRADHISPGFNGKLLELIHTAPVLFLPAVPPKPDGEGDNWTIEIKNLGPAAVTVEDNARFTVRVNVNQTVNIYAKKQGYSTTP